MLEAEAQAIALTNALHMAAPKPENYKVVSWPDDPAAVVKRSGGNDDEVTPGQYIYYMPLGEGCLHALYPF